jgi:hypothetical protein
MRYFHAFPRAWVFVLVVCVGAISTLVPRSTLEVGKRRSNLPLPPAATRDTTSLSHLLWPGSFDVPPDGATRHVQFSAAGRRYVATIGSDGFSVTPRPTDQGAVSVRFVGSAVGRPGTPGRARAGEFNVFAGDHGLATVSHWRRYEDITYRDVYPGVDARFRSSSGEMELDFLVQPNAHPSQIALRAESGTNFSLDAATGDVLAWHGKARFRLRRPRAFQPGPSDPIEVAALPVINGDVLTFRLTDYDPTRALTIDPLIATYSTYVGTNSDAMYDDSAALATDSQGNIYVGGLTQFDAGDSFPTTPTSLQPTNPRSAGANCAFQCGYVLKLSPAHEVLYGSLIYGFSVKALAVDSAGAAYITGNTLDGTDFPGTPGVFDNDPAGQVFLSKITADGTAFAYSALFPGEIGNGIAVDAQGNAYVVGNVDVPNLPTTPGSIKPTSPAGATVNEEGFLLKVNATGSTLVYGTYLGGSGADSANGVVVDSLGQATVVGQTASSDFTGFTATPSGPSDAFALQVSADGSRFVNGRFFGGVADDWANAIAPDGQGGYLMCGATTSANFPATAGVLQTRLLGQRNGWIQRLDSAFNVVYSTYFGGLFIDGCLAITADATANAYLVGVTFSGDIPTTRGAFQDTTSAITSDALSDLSDVFYVLGAQPDREAYFAELSPDGKTLLYGSYLGGYETTPRDFPPLTIGSGVVITPTGSIYASGATEAASFPVTDGGLRNGMGGQADGFVVEFAQSGLAVTSPSRLPQAPVGQSYSYTLAASGGLAPYTWSVVGFHVPDGITLSPSGVLSGSAANNQTEDTGYQFTVKVTDATGAAAYKSEFINVRYPGTPVCSGTTCTESLLVGQATIIPPPLLARGVSPFSILVAGPLPPGFSINTQQNQIDGTPTTVGNYQFALVVTDAIGQTATLTWKILVASTVPPTATLSATPQSLTTGGSVTLTWSSTNTAGCTAGGGGANGAPWSGALLSSGTATQSATVSGTFVYTISCADGGQSAQAQAAVTVAAPSQSSGGGGGGGGALGALELGLCALLGLGRIARSRRPVARLSQ